MSTQRNKVSHVFTIARAAKDLGVEEEVLHTISLGMDPEEGVIWVYGPAEDDAVMAFTDEGIDELRNLLTMYKEDPEIFTKQW